MEVTYILPTKKATDISKFTIKSDVVPRIGELVSINFVLDKKKSLKVEHDYRVVDVCWVINNEGTGVNILLTNGSIR